MKLDSSGPPCGHLDRLPNELLLYVRTRAPVLPAFAQETGRGRAHRSLTATRTSQSPSSALTILHVSLSPPSHADMQSVGRLTRDTTLILRDLMHGTVAKAAVCPA